MAKAGGGGGGGKKGGGGRSAAGGGAPAESQPAVKLDYATETDLHESNAMVYNTDEKYSAEGAFVEDLSNKNTDAITAYQGFQVVGGERFAGLNAEKVNKALYDPAHRASLTAEKVAQVKAYVKELNANLEKVKKYQGETYRVVDNVVYGDAKAAGLHSKYEVGKINVHPEFLSTSRTPDAAFSYSNAYTTQMRIKITGVTGRSVEKNPRGAGFIGEREVVFPTGRKTITTSKKWNKGRQNWDIEITEVL